MGSNIILIGMPGAGKSTAGVILAKITGLSFVDTDLLIQEQKGMLLNEIIEAYGVEGFLDTECMVVKSLKTKNCVIATGGSVIYKKASMDNLSSLGTICYLSLPYDELKDRLFDIKGRGVVLKDGQDLKKLYDERTPLYEKYADVTIDESGLNVEETIKKIVEKVFRGEKWNNIL